MEKLQESLIDEEYKIWRKNIPLLYDLMYSQSLTWPSPCIQWFPFTERIENRFTVQKLLMTTFTSGESPEHLLFGSVTFPDIVDEDCINNADIKFKFSQSIPLTLDINKARISPLASNIIACRSDGPDIFVYDYTKHSSSGSTAGPDTILSGHTEGGFALDWNPMKWGELVTGGRDNLVNIFNINKGLVSSSQIHTEVVNDVSFSHFDPHMICSVSDDLALVLHDTRSKSASKNVLKVDKAHFKSIESCAFSPLKAEVLATGSSDCSIKIWDTRNLSTPLFILRGHKGSVNVVRWSPHYESLLASSSPDRRVMLWDLNKTNVDCQESLESPELLFVHGGHTSSVDDISWNPAEPMEIASVSNDGLLHIWKISAEEFI